MYSYDMIAIILTGIGHVLLYIQLIDYNRLSYKMLIALSITFTILLGIVVITTGYPEFNIIMLLLFLLSLGLMKEQLTMIENLYFTLVSMVGISLVKIVLMETGMKLFMWSPFNLYLWTPSIIGLIVSIIIVTFIGIFHRQIKRLAHFIINSSLYYISYGLLILGMITALVLINPSISLLATVHKQYGQISYITAFILFFILLLIGLISWHLAKERLLEAQQDNLDEEMLNYVKKLEYMHDELASFRHDYMNILLTLDAGIRTKNIAQIEQVYYDIIAPTSKLMNNRELDIVKLSRITISEVKSLLSMKVISAQQQDIKVVVDIPQRVEEISIPIVAFIRSISILVDNGIEEAACSEEKVLEIAFFEIERCQYFIVRNSCKEESIDLQQIYAMGYSSKGKKRGYGLFSLKRLIDQIDNATLETNFTASYFTQTLVLKRQ